MTLWDLMLQLYEGYGYYKEGLHTVTMKGVTGSAKIAAIMESFRTNPPKEFGKFKVVAFRDYDKNVVVKADGTTSETGLPKSNVLYFELDNDAWCCLRPSGTEPKIKFYMGVKGESLEDADALLKELTEAMLANVDAE